MLKHQEVLKYVVCFVDRKQWWYKLWNKKGESLLTSDTGYVVEICIVVLYFALGIYQIKLRSIPIVLRKCQMSNCYIMH